MRIQMRIHEYMYGGFLRIKTLVVLGLYLPSDSRPRLRHRQSYKGKSHDYAYITMI